jgi:hypothetical protein
MHVLVDVPLVLVAVMTGLLTFYALRATMVWWVFDAALPTGLLCAATMWLPPGVLSTILVAPYALVCATAGVVGARRLFAKRWPPTELAQHAALVVLAGACTWLVAYRAGHALLGYPPLWVLLTAAHFHVAGCYLPIVIGSVGKGALAQVCALGCVLGLPLTALGILVGGPLETAAAMVMAASALGVAVFLLVSERGLVRLAGLPLAAGMILAILYALRGLGTAFVIFDLDPLSSMIVTHAVLDTAFAALALVALNRRIAIRR